jgi:hypothetical protein
MKKNLLKGLAVVAFAMIAGYNVYQAHSETEDMTELMLANVEALAQTEIIRCVSVTGGTLFYCKKTLLNICYCDGLKPGLGWLQTNNPYD